LAEEWDRQVAQVATALDTFGATGDVLEMAGGTGWWTERLARTAGHLTVIDSSPETLDLNRDRVGRPDVDDLIEDSLGCLEIGRTIKSMLVHQAGRAHVPHELVSRHLVADEQV
jgi:protein-L-isoaspartate O-methyltransferase